MTNEDTIIYIWEVPLGWEQMLYAGNQEAVAIAYFQKLRKSRPVLLVIDDRAIFSLWVCGNPIWPLD